MINARVAKMKSQIEKDPSLNVQQDGYSDVTNLRVRRIVRVPTENKLGIGILCTLRLYAGTETWLMDAGCCFISIGGVSNLFSRPWHYFSKYVGNTRAPSEDDLNAATPAYGETLLYIKSLSPHINLNIDRLQNLFVQRLLPPPEPDDD
jgi:hypothetical protein